MDSTCKGRFPNLNQTKSKQALSFYHDCMLRVFENHASRKSEYLGNVLFSTAKSGDVSKLWKALEKVDFTMVDFNLRERNTENTPLMVAAEHGHDQIIQILLSCGSDATLKNAAGQTIFENASERITELILDSVNRPGAGQPLLCQAAWQGNASVIKKLLCLNPNLNVNHKNSEGLTPLLLVTRDLDFFRKVELNFFVENYNPTEVVSLLLHQNADCTIVDNDGRSALHLTAGNHGTNARNIISLLARKDSLNVDLRDTQHYSALHFASEAGDPNVMLALIDNGANVNAKGPFGRTPLHMTASRGDEKTSEILVEHGANVLLVDDLGFTPLDVAKGNNVLVLLKEAWTEHSQRCMDSVRIKSAPVTLPVKLDHLDVPDVTDLMMNDDESEVPSKKTCKKSNKKLSHRSHSEDETRPVFSSGLPTRTRSFSSGPSSRSRLLPMNEDILQSQSDDGSVSPATQKTCLTKTNPSESNLRPNKSPQPETIPRPTARVAVLNIDLKGYDLHKQKSKSWSELPFTRFRVQKLPAPRACSTEAEPLSNPLSLRGRSVSAASLSSFEILPGITSEAMHDEGDVEKGEGSSSPDPSHELEIVVTPPANGVDSIVDDQSPNPDTDIFNKTFNCKETSVFKFPNDTNTHDYTNSAPMSQNSAQGFFVDWNQLETPLQKCTKCLEEFKPEELKPGTSICNSCHRDSIAKDTFWVPFGSSNRKSKTGMQTGCSDGRNVKSGARSASSNDCNTRPGTSVDERGILTETRSSSVDDRTICIDKETLSILRKKKLSLGSLGSENFSQNSTEVEKTKQGLKRTLSDTTAIQKSHRRIESANSDGKQREIPTVNDTECHESIKTTSGIREISGDSTTCTRNSFKCTSVDRSEPESFSTELCNKVWETANVDREQDGDFTIDSRKTSAKDDSVNAALSEESDGILKQEKYDGLVKQETDKVDVSFVKDKENEHETVVPKNVSRDDHENSNHSATEIPDGLSVETDHDKLDLVVPENLIEKSVDKNIANTNCVHSPRQKPNSLSYKELAKSNQFLQRFVSDIKSVEKGKLSTNVIARLSNQSPGGKGSLVDQSSMGKVDFVKQSMAERDCLLQTNSKNVTNNVKTVDDSECSELRTEEAGCSGIEMDKTSGVVMDNRDHFGQEHVNTDVTPHQVVIVNPFPSPVPPKTPVVNIASNCQCDRFASFAKNPGTGGKKKGRGKKTGANSNSSGRENWSGGKKTSIVGKGKTAPYQKHISNVAGKTKPSMRIISAGKKGKKKVRNSQNEILKEVSVIQPNLKADLIEDEENSSTSPNTSEDSVETGIVSAPVRQATFVKEKFTVLSPILEASHSGSSVQDSYSNVFRTQSEIIDDSSMKESSAPTVTGEVDSSLPNNPVKWDNPVTQDVAPPLSNNDVDNSQPCNSELNGRTFEMDDNLDDLIQEILDQTDELETNHPNSHSSGKSNTDERKKITGGQNTHSDARAGQTVSHANSKSNSDINYQSKVSSWLREQNNESTIANDLSCKSSGLTPTAEQNELSSDCSSFSDDVASSSSHVTVTSGCGKIRENKSVTSSKTISRKASSSEAHSAKSAMSSVTLPLPTPSDTSMVGGVSGEQVCSRLSRCKSETSGTGSELTSSSEEEIVWRKGNMLGKGAFGKVYCGLTNTGQMIAVKQVELITSNVEQAERQYEKLQEEVALLKSLRHENVVSYLGTCLDGGVVNIFMQFVPGGSIALILARFGPLEERVFRYYTKQILVGVEYLHRNNVVHRDIKGGNIMLMPTGVIKLIDFGCAKRLCMNMSQSQGDLLRSMKGTPYWMAPEVIRETGYGRKSDIWSIGCTVFEMATGKPPWSNLPPMSAILAIGQGSAPPKLGKPNSDDACNFVSISMARDPDKRLSAEELLRHPFILQCDDQR